MPLSILRLSVITAATLLPACLRVGAFVLPVTSTRGISKEGVSSSSSGRLAASIPSTATATSSSSVEEAKSNLKRALVENKGSTLAKDVIAAVEVSVRSGKSVISTYQV